MFVGLASLVIAAAGILGGAVNALMTDNDFALPQPTTVSRNGTVIRVMQPGYLVNMLLGGVASVISWGLYGPFSAVAVLSSGSSGAAASPIPDLTVTMVVTGILVGIGGARWLTDQVDKKLLKAAAVKAASAGANPAAAQLIAVASPREALSVANGMSAA